MLSLISVIISYPLSILDRSYPFYAEGSVYFGLFLTLLNVAFQSIFVMLLTSIIKNINQ